MKKIMVTFLSLILLISLFTPVAFADSDKDKPDKSEKAAQQQEKKDEQQEKKAAVKERIQERKEAREELKAEFQERMLERQQLRDASKAEIKEQRQLVLQYKEQLKEFKGELEGLSDEERAEYSDEIKALVLQIRNAHKQQLEIARAYKDQIKEILPGVRTGEAPSKEEVQDVAEAVIDEL